MSMMRVCLLLILLLPAENRPVPKFPISKETTYVTGPLTKDGYIDYAAALNDRLGKGITPEKNANVLLWKAVGPRAIFGERMPAEFFKRLGIDVPPQRGDYFVGLEAYGKKHLKLDPDQLNALRDHLDRTVQRVWTANDYPDITGWLENNAKPLALIMEATRRPYYFNPHVSRGDKPGGMIDALPVLQYVELANALTARALLRAGEGKFDEAWQDLLACHRLGRLVGRGTNIETFVGVAIDRVASKADFAYLTCIRLTSQKLRADLKELDGLPPLHPLADSVDLGERFFALDYVQLIRHDGLNTLEGPAGGLTPKKPDPREEKALAAIDWEPALRCVNHWFDRMTTAMRIKDRGERQKEFERLEKEAGVLKKETIAQAAYFFRLLGWMESGKSAGKKIGNTLAITLVPANLKMQIVFDGDEQVQRNLHLAFALAAYQRDHSRYPAKLDELAPKYLSAIPNDLFSGKPLIYRPSAKGYLLYSVGVNGLDEGGQGGDDIPRGDDLAVRMPLPDLKRD